MIDMVVERKNLLSDDEMRQFIVKGYHAVEPGFPKKFYEGIHAKIKEIFERRGNPGNEIYEEVPDLEVYYSHPAIVGALTSIVGANYRINGHRHCHDSPPDVEDFEGSWLHQDSPNVRNDYPAWALTMWYPHDVTMEMGPTVVLPGSQYHPSTTQMVNASTDESERHSLILPAGTLAICHHELWHGRRANRSNQTRYMIKFLFDRMENPSEATWDADPERKNDMNFPNVRLSNDTDWEVEERGRTMRAVWLWLHGMPHHWCWPDEVRSAL